MCANGSFNILTSIGVLSLHVLMVYDCAPGSFNVTINQGKLNNGIKMLNKYVAPYVA